MTVLNCVIAFILIGGGFIYFIACWAAFVSYVRPLRSFSGTTPNVSVIVPARNEEHTIGLVLDDILNQTYPCDSLEIIVVDDCSWDGTSSVVRRFMERDSRIRLIETRGAPFTYRYKKRAVNEGIQVSRGEIIMTVDADCRVPRGWVSGIIRLFSPGIDLVAGEVIVEGKGPIGLFEALELNGIQAMAVGFLNMGFPVTCNGANLAYRRSAFERVNGFHGIGGIVSGDDDLLMQKIAKGNPSRVKYVTGRKTAVWSKGVANIGEFFVKRSRWASKTIHYPSRAAVFVLSVFFVFFVSILAGFALWIAGLSGYHALLAGAAMKAGGDLLLTAAGTVRTGRAHLMTVFPVAEIMHIPYIIVVTLNGVFGSFVWRGRKVQARCEDCPDHGE